MKTEQYKLAGVNIDVQVPETLEEAVEIAGTEKVLDAYVDHVIYHPFATAARTRLAAELEKKYPNNKRTTEKDGEKDVINEAPNDYVNRLRKEVGLTDADIVAVLQPIADKLPFAQVAKAERAASTAKPGKSFYQIVERAQAKDGNLVKFAANCSAKLGRPVDPNNVDDCAKAVQSIMLALNKEQAARKKAAEQALTA